MERPAIDETGGLEGADDVQDGWVEVATLADLEAHGPRVVAAGGHSVALFADHGRVFALDNRCPHMGFPLHRGTVRDGILTCHWHHARFDLAGGSTLDPFADDATCFPVEVRDGAVWLDPRPVERERRDHWLRKLDEGLEQGIRLVLAKAVIGLQPFDATADVLRRAALFGIRNRAGGWSTGLSILTAMANSLPSLEETDRPLALYQGLVHVARSTQGQAPSFDLEPLDTSERRPERYLSWFRRFVEVRSGDAAERTLRTAIRVGLPPADVATMIFAACTDHLFLDVGHSLDFANKAFELLDHIGWEHAEDVLPSLVPSLVRATRMEETSSWRHPVDLAELLGGTYERLPSVLERPGRLRADWRGHREIAEQVLDGEPADTVAALEGLLGEGVPPTELSAAVAYAAARRPVHFSVSNEFSDWDTVHHTFTYANAVDQAMRRAPSALIARGIFDGAMSVYLERFLNVPRRPIPGPRGGRPSRSDLHVVFDRHGAVDEAGQMVADLVEAQGGDEAIRALGHAMLREDAGFHQFQMYEAGIRQARRFQGTPLAGHVLVGVARFLAAHSPTVRAVGQTFDIAARLARGEALHEET